MRTTFPPTFAARDFQVWEYQVSHGQLLIRSPKSPASGSSPERLTNIDLVFLGVRYIAVPSSFRGLEVVTADSDELRSLEATFGEQLTPSHVHVLRSAGKGYPIVATHFGVSENHWDIFDSPFEFRSHFRRLEK
jgi:hypothetical protein